MNNLIRSIIVMVLLLGLSIGCKQAMKETETSIGSGIITIQGQTYYVRINKEEDYLVIREHSPTGTAIFQKNHIGAATLTQAQYDRILDEFKQRH